MLAFVQFLIDSLGAICGMIASVMFDSPFQAVKNIALANDVVGIVNWIVPVDAIVGVLQLWVFAIGVYYSYSAIMRIVKAIE